MHRRSLERFDFDLGADALELVLRSTAPTRRLRGHGQLVRAAPGRDRDDQGHRPRPWAAGATRDRTTRYQPLEAEDDIRAAVRWVLARPGIFLNSVGDVSLPAVLRAAATVEEPDAALMARLNERSRPGHDLRPVGARIARRPWALSQPADLPASCR